MSSLFVCAQVWSVWGNGKSHSPCSCASGFACGPALAGVIGDHYGLSAPFFLCGAGMSIAAGSALVFLPETMRITATENKMPQKVVLQSDTPTAAKKQVNEIEGTKDQAVWHKWSKLLKVPNLQAVYVRSQWPDHISIITQSLSPYAANEFFGRVGCLED